MKPSPGIVLSNNDFITEYRILLSADNTERLIGKRRTVDMKNVKKRCSIGLALVMAVSALFCGSTGITARAAGNEEIAPEDISVTWEDSRVYTELTLGYYETMTTYGVKGYEDVPFVSVHEYLDILCKGRERIRMEDGVMTVIVNGAEAVIDPEADSIRIDNPARFCSYGNVDGAIIEDDEYNVITWSVKNESVQQEADPVVIDLAAYHMPVVAFEDTVIMPFLALQNTFGSIRMKNDLAYNGKDYFNVFEAEKFVVMNNNMAAKESPYFKAMYSGPFSEKTETTQAYADYGYYSVCLLLDLTFGHKEEKNIPSFDEYFTRMNAKEAMCSTSPSSALMAEIMLFNYLFDSGHDSLVSETNVFRTAGAMDPTAAGDLADSIRESEAGKELFGDSPESTGPAAGQNPAVDVIMGALLEKGFKLPEIVPLFVWGYCLQNVRPEDYGSQRLDYAGDTAVIYFNAFKDNTSDRKPSYYLDPITEEDAENSTFAFFYRCFEDIQQHPGVKNIVINISDNGGGAAAALVSVLGFLSEDGEVRITDRNMLSGNYREECYHVDTNLDGIADDQDGFGGQYDFYVLCSGSSYSCGNALPYYAQQGSLATVIGAKPGGGDCVVANFTDAYGRCAVYSGMLKLGTEDGGVFVSDEKATVPELNMMPSVWNVLSVPWFDAEGIADAVHQYQNGVKELVYNDKSDEEKLTEFLTGLLERIEKVQQKEAAKE